MIASRRAIRGVIAGFAGCSGTVRATQQGRGLVSVRIMNHDDPPVSAVSRAGATTVDGEEGVQRGPSDNISHSPASSHASILPLSKVTSTRARKIVKKKINGKMMQRCSSCKI